MKDNLLYKNRAEAFVIKQVESDFVHIEGMASTFGNMDRAGDIIVKGAFTNTLTNPDRKIKLLYQHNMDEPIGVIDKAVETDEGLFIMARMPKANDTVRNMLPLLKMGALGDFSIGFNIVDSEVTPDGNHVIKEIDLWEVSIVTIPANAKAKITSVKSVIPFQDLPIADASMNWDSTAAIKRIRAATDSEESPSAAYKRAFLWYDTQDKENFGAYKLPIADVVGGNLKVVPRAIFAAAAALRGARGGISIPDADKQKVISHLGRYYDKMGKESPFEKSDQKLLSVEDVEYITTRREFEQLLSDSGLFTRKACIALGSKFKEIKQRDSAASEEEKQRDSAIDKAILDELAQIKALFK